MRGSSILLVLFMMLTSCIFMHYDDSVNLGEGYYYVPDGDYSSIVKSVRKEYDGIGEEIIPPKVIQYKYNENFIIAKSHDINAVRYWIIDKRVNSRVLPLDSISFYEMNKKQGTGLTF